VDTQELSVLQSVDWGAVAFGIVLVELDGKNATKDTDVRHLLAAQGHVYQLVEVAPVPCQHSYPMLCTHIPRGLGFCGLLTATQPKQPMQAPLGSPVTPRRPQITAWLSTQVYDGSTGAFCRAEIWRNARLVRRHMRKSGVRQPPK